MTDKNIFITAAKRVSCGASNYSCLAVRDVGSLRGKHVEVLNVLREWYSNAFSPSISRKVITEDIAEAVDERGCGLEDTYKSVPQRRFRVLLLLMAAACVGDMRGEGEEQ